MFSIAAIDHIVLRTAELPRMVEFYCNVLGCDVERELPAEVGLVQLRAGDALIDIVAVDSELGRQGGPAPSGQGNNLDHFCLRLEPVSEEELREQLLSKGVAVGEFADRYGAEGFGRSLYIEDPDGNTVELRSTKGVAERD